LFQLCFLHVVGDSNSKHCYSSCLGLIHIIVQHVRIHVTVAVSDDHSHILYTRTVACVGLELVINHPPYGSGGVSVRAVVWRRQHGISQ